MELLSLLAYLVAISCCFAMVNFIAWIMFERPRHALLWSGVYFLAALQYTLNIVRESLFSPEFYWISANTISFTLVIMAVWGHRARLRLPDRRGLMLAILLTLSGTSILATAVYDLPGIRIAIAPAFTFVSMTYAAFLLIRCKRVPRLAQLLAAALHFGFGLTQGAAAVLGSQLGSNSTAAEFKFYQLVNFALMPVFYMAMGIAVILLLATDLAYRFKHLALTDQLTGVANRRGFTELTEKLLAQAKRTAQPLTLIMCDLDHFKKVNDRFGHGVGDIALQHFGKILIQSTRREDAVGRLGGEEFAITLGGLDAAEAEIVAARIQQALADQLQIDEKVSLQLSSSFGIAELGPGDDSNSLLARADKAVYQSKAAGRNTVSVAPAASYGAA